MVMDPEALSRPSRADLGGVIAALDRLIENAREAADSEDADVGAEDIVGVTAMADLVGRCVEACSDLDHEQALDAAFTAQIEGRHRTITDSDLAYRALVFCGLANWASGKDLQ